MKSFLILLALSFFAISNLFAEEKNEQIDSFISLQRKVFEIAKSHPNPFKTRTSNLSKEVSDKIDALKLNDLKSEQLWRIGIASSVASYPQTAEDKAWDAVFEDVCWRCVKIIASRPGWENTHYLKSMKALFGTDGGPSLWFKDYIEAQEKLNKKE